jgi:AhpD family alkylhydroperoxidase
MMICQARKFRRTNNLGGRRTTAAARLFSHTAVGEIAVADGCVSCISIHEQRVAARGWERAALDESAPSVLNVQRATAMEAPVA